MNVQHPTSNIQRSTENPKSAPPTDGIPPQAWKIRNPKWVIHRFESVTSTNDAAIRMAEEGAPEGTVVIASEQTAGRGRRGRHWTSPRGAGLYLSIILRPDIPFEHLWQLGFVAAVASAEAVGQASGLFAQIKWPNDVLLGGKKVCGILVEGKPSSSFAKASEDKVASCQLPVASKSAICIVGIGINVNAREISMDIREKATSIALELGRPIPIENAEDTLLSRLDTWYSRYLAEGFAPILGAWKNLDCTIGRRVAIENTEGTAVGISETGDLTVRHDDGSMVSISTGDVILRI